MANTALHRSVSLLLTNKSWASVSYGAVVLVDSATALSFTTTTSAALASDVLGVVLEPNGIASNAQGLVVTQGYCPRVNLSASASLGDTFNTHTVAGQAAAHAAIATGDFGEVLGTGTTPACVLWGYPTQAGGGGGGAPTDADYWVETANASLSAEVVVGTTGISTAAYASRQAAAKAGRVFLPSDGFVVERDSGSAWAPWGPIFPLTSPVSADFAWVNQGTATVTTTYGGVYLLAPDQGAANNFRIRKKAVTAPYTITAHLLPAIQAKNYHQVGLCFRQSSDGKLHTFGQLFVSTIFNLASTKWTNETTFSADYQVSAILDFFPFMRIADNSTNRICSVSADGQNWITIHTVLRTDFLTADEVGFFANAHNSATPNFDAGVTLISWKQT